MQVQYFNPDIHLWEPFLEQWSPDLKFATSGSGSELLMISSSTLVFSITGIMLDRLLQTYSVLFRSEEDRVIGSNDRREEVCGNT